jgi:hypothetical protein
MLCTSLIYHVYNIHNSVRLIIHLQNMGINENMQICLLDITNVYTNILKLDQITIVTNILNSNSEYDEKAKRNYTLKH